MYVKTYVIVNISVNEAYNPCSVRAICIACLRMLSCAGNKKMRKACVHKDIRARSDYVMKALVEEAVAKHTQAALQKSHTIIALLQTQLAA
jgi:hypothetical protein